MGGAREEGRGGASSSCSLRSCRARDPSSLPLAISDEYGNEKESDEKGRHGVGLENVFLAKGWLLFGVGMIASERVW